MDYQWQLNTGCRLDNDIVMFGVGAIIQKEITLGLIWNNILQANIGVNHINNDKMKKTNLCVYIGLVYEKYNTNNKI